MKVLTKLTYTIWINIYMEHNSWCIYKQIISLKGHECVDSVSHNDTVKLVSYQSNCKGIIISQSL